MPYWHWIWVQPETKFINTKTLRRRTSILKLGVEMPLTPMIFCLILNKLDPKHEERWQVSSATELYSCGEGKLGYVFRSLRSESLLLVCGVALRSDSGSRGWVCFIDVSAHIWPEWRVTSSGDRVDWGEGSPTECWHWDQNKGGEMFMASIGLTGTLLRFLSGFTSADTLRWIMFKQVYPTAVVHRTMNYSNVYWNCVFFLVSPYSMPWLVAHVLCYSCINSVEWPKVV